MKPLPKRVRDTQLSARYSVSSYLELKAAGDSAGIANMLKSRLSERYWRPIRPSAQSGFLELAISCLLVEFFWSLKKGWKDSNKESRKSFQQFFESSTRFSVLQKHADSFYTHVRCGLLHQAETTGGWKVSKRADNRILIAPKTIQAHKFFIELKSETDEFLTSLAKKPLSDGEWKPVLKKLDYIVDNCR